MKLNKRAFTLIELLVVVLIIGILAAIAIPQYQKAVEKSRLAEAYAVMGTFKQAIDAYLLSNPTTQEYTVPVLDVEMPCPKMTANDTNPNGAFACKNFIYELYCLWGKCYINAFRYHKSDYTDMRQHYVLGMTKPVNGGWTAKCIYYRENSLGHQICKTLPDTSLGLWQW